MATEQTTARQATSVELQDVCKDFGSNRVLKNLDLRVEPGEFVSLLGPSGCGKTTALRLVAGLEQVTSGVIRLDGADVSNVPTNKRDIGMVFQSYSLFPHMTALQNTMFGLQMRKTAPAEARERSLEALDMVGLAGFDERYPHALSGGQQQRVAVARALVTSPRVLLLDEPLSALDAQVRMQLRVELRHIQQNLGITTIFVTHDQEEALAISDRVAVMNAGRIEQIGEPEQLYLEPHNTVVAGFVGASTLVDAVVTGRQAKVWGLTVPVLGDVPDGPCQIYLRPENVRVVADGEPGAEATVETTTFLGPVRRTLLRMPDAQLLTIQHPAAQHLDVGTKVRVNLSDSPVAAAPKK